MPEFTLASRIQEVVDLGDRGRQLLWKHGYDVGEGFVDGLSSYQSLEAAARGGRLRDATKLLGELNTPPPTPAAGSGGTGLGQPARSGVRPARPKPAAKRPAR